MVRNHGEPGHGTQGERHRRRDALRPQERRPSRPARAGTTGPIPDRGRVNRSARADAFAAFADEVLRDLEPPRAARIGRRPTTSSTPPGGSRRPSSARRPAASPTRRPRPAGREPKRPRPDAADRAARSVREALESLDYAPRARRPASRLAPARDRSTSSNREIEPNEWPIVPVDDVRGPPTRSRAPRTTTTPDLARSAGLRLRGLRHLAGRQGDLDHGRPRRLADRQRLDLGRHPPLAPRADRGRHPDLRRLRHGPGSGRGLMLRRRSGRRAGYLRHPVRGNRVWVMVDG